MFLSKFRKKPQSNMYLGSITVVPRSGIKHVITKIHQTNLGQNDDVVINTLTQLISLTSISSVDAFDDSDLILDIIVPDYELGDFLPLSIGTYFIPIMWRPKITITARVFNAKSNETVYSTTLKKNFPWKLWFKKIWSFSVIIRHKPAMTNADIERFTIQAATELLIKISKNI